MCSLLQTLSFTKPTKVSHDQGRFFKSAPPIMPLPTSPSSSRRNVLITGCSAHGLGHALAIAFHNAGLRVFATARDPAKMEGLAELGIECLQLDVLDEESIKRCVGEVRKLTSREGERGGGKLDCLVNNAGGGEFSLFSLLSLSSHHLRNGKRTTKKCRKGRVLAMIAITILEVGLIHSPKPSHPSPPSFPYNLLTPSRLQHAHLRYLPPRRKIALRSQRLVLPHHHPSLPSPPPRLRVLLRNPQPDPQQHLHLQHRSHAPQLSLSRQQSRCRHVFHAHAD